MAIIYILILFNVLGAVGLIASVAQILGGVKKNRNLNQ
jgi:hypothetical protein